MFHKRLLGEFKENKKRILGMVLTQWVMLAANMILIMITAEFVSDMVKGKAPDDQIAHMMLLLGIVLLIRSMMSLHNSRLSFQASEAVKEGLRTKIYKKLMALGGRCTESFQTSEIVQISTEGVEQLEIYFGRYIPQFFYSLLAPVTLFIVVGGMSLKVAIVLLCCVPLIPVSIITVQKFAKKMLAKYWGTYTEMGDSFLECLQGLTTLKIYQADGRYAKKMEEEAEKFRKVTMGVLIMQLNSISIMDLVAYGGAAAGIILSIVELHNGTVSLAQCLFMILVSSEFFLPLRLLGSFFHIAMNGNAAADKIFRLLDLPEEAGEKRRKEFQDNTISFRQVYFSYEKEKQILSGMSFSINHGLTALVGESGCGKSTVISLIMGEGKPGQGQIAIGGVDREELDSRALHRKVTRISHNSYLFQGTIRENLKMGKECATDKEMLDVLEQVNLSEFIQKNGGLDYMLTEKAANLSGGQRQRLALARAVLHDSDIYIFDEATSNVDVESENDIMKMVRGLSRNKSVLLISHRLANVMEADKIYAMKGGKIMEEGRHKELCEKKGYYYKLFQQQRRLEQYGKECVYE